MKQAIYFMESEKEARRLDIKTNASTVRKQAKWAGVQPGMRVADLGCGAGKTTAVLGEFVRPNGRVVGIDIAASRISFAKENYSAQEIDFIQGDVRNSLDSYGQFDLVWIRFVLEYYRTEAWKIVQNAYNVLKPGGIICLMDLDYNCLSHYGLSETLETSLRQVISKLQAKADFDPYMGRKLYSFLYDLGCEDLLVKMTAHHLIYGNLSEPDRYNWTRKVEAAQPLFESEAAFQEFEREFAVFFDDPRRFTYTPLILVRGRKPHG